MQGITHKAEEYYRQILSTLSSGDRLPSERSVMRELDTCRSTIRIVLVKLCAEGLMYPVHGKGYYKV